MGLLEFGSGFILRRDILKHDDLAFNSLEYSFGEWINVRYIVFPVSVSVCQQLFDRSYVGRFLMALQFPAAKES